MTAPLAYRESCVPVAVAALTGLDVIEVAGALYAAGAARLSPVAPGGDVGWGTEMHGAGELLVRRGFAVELWHGDGHRIADAEVYPLLLAELAHESVLEVRRPPAEEAPGRAAPEWRRLGEWRQRPGDWLLNVVTPPGGAHALAVRDGQVIAGGDVGDEWPVIDALRVYSTSGG